MALLQPSHDQPAAHQQHPPTPSTAEPSFVLSSRTSLQNVSDDSHNTTQAAIHQASPSNPHDTILAELQGSHHPSPMTDDTAGAPKLGVIASAGSLGAPSRRPLPPLEPLVPPHPPRSRQSLCTIRPPGVSLG
ncbi:hypothetical protein A0H81_00815 [Grifola frondosa]|uniref:Uncharacterized protein n=1 Tax=Grifola frondosa TaxID=5627 RepID=A0A1C7MP66_GRIFR|nr:hypothetical protein A0H81_00815 [Grifola frondosa]